MSSKKLKPEGKDARALQSHGNRERANTIGHAMLQRAKLRSEEPVEPTVKKPKPSTPMSKAVTQEDHEEYTQVDVVNSIVVKPVVLEEGECYAFYPLYTETVTEWPPTKPVWTGISEDEMGKDPVLTRVMEDWDDLTPVVANIVLRRRTQRGNVSIPYTVRRYDHSLIGSHYTTIIYAKRRGGKSTVLKDIMLSRRKFFPRVVVFTGTAMDCEYYSILPSSAVVAGFKPHVLYEILKDQIFRVGEMHLGRINDRNINLMLVFDDCLANNLRYQKLLDVLFFNGRHLKIEIYVVSQDTKGLPPGLTGNTDMIFLSRMRAQRDKETMREKFVDFLRNDEQYDELIDDTLLRLDDYPWTIIHAAYPAVQGRDALYAASFEHEEETDKPLVMGDRAFWEGHEDELIQHPGGEELLTASDKDWGVIQDHTPGFKLEKYVPKELTFIQALLSDAKPS